MMRILIVLLALFTSPVQAQDMFLFNATGYTQQYGEVASFDALLIKDGRVQAVGSESILRPYAGEAVQRDLGGKVVLPGLVHAADQLTGLCAALEQEALQACLLDVLRNRASEGFTLLQDSATSPAAWSALEALRDTGALPVRVFGAIDELGAFYSKISSKGPYVGTYKGLLFLRAVSLAGGQTCGQSLPAEINPVAQRNRIARGVMRGYQMRLAGTTPDTFLAALGAYEDVIAVAGTSGRHVLSPLGDFDIALAPRLAAAGLVVPIGQCGEAIGHFGALIEGGVNTALAAETPFEAIEQIARSAAGPQVRRDAFSAATMGGAYAGFVDQALGSLETGKWADFIIVDKDIFAVKASAISETVVLETWVAGRQVYDATD